MIENSSTADSKQDTVTSPHPPDELFPVVYNELRRLAVARLALEKPGQTLQATALVHEAYLRLGNSAGAWKSPEHFFNVAAEVMRRILVDGARRKSREKNGGRWRKSGCLRSCLLAMIRPATCWHSMRPW